MVDARLWFITHSDLCVRRASTNKRSTISALQTLVASLGGDHTEVVASSAHAKLDAFGLTISKIVQTKVECEGYQVNNDLVMTPNNSKCSVCGSLCYYVVY